MTVAQILLLFFSTVENQEIPKVSRYVLILPDVLGVVYIQVYYVSLAHTATEPLSVPRGLQVPRRLSPLFPIWWLLFDDDDDTIYLYRLDL